ncbi:MAG TPA: hypothetical protein GX714_12180 [Chloroflexi bacterium]|jgi:hypothetical protein|nr:hypothetical protein [Chloroflexota bacterium]
MTWRRGVLADFMGDAIVYRNLEPLHPDVPGLREAWRSYGLDHYYIPRKTSPPYATVLLRFLQHLQRARGVAAPLQQALFIGDTLMNDGTAAQNLAQHLPMLGFIGADRTSEPERIEMHGDLMVANRWSALHTFLARVQAAGVPLDERTALLLDLDKTCLGARGRNDAVIDAARVAAVQRTMRSTLGDAFDLAAFRAVYDPLNQPTYHPFTGDNQDYLAYICLMVVGGVYPAEELWRDLQTGDVTTIEGFADRCEARRERMTPGLQAAHREVREGIAAEDPTPFKAFRRREYLETVGRMDTLPDDASVEDVLAHEIVITAEVADLASHLATQGVLVFGISDKPDEASLPTREQAAAGCQPLHRTPMKVYGAAVL